MPWCLEGPLAVVVFDQGEMKRWLHCSKSIKYIKEYSPDDLKRKGSLRFDFAILDEKHFVVYFIEYDGELHYGYSNSGWDNAERFQRTVESDNLKNIYCQQHHIPLIRIPYTRYDKLDIADLVLATSEFIIS